MRSAPVVSGHPRSLAHKVEALAVDDPSSAVDTLDQLEVAITEYMSHVPADAPTVQRARDLETLLAALRRSLLGGHVRSITGLERQVRLLVLDGDPGEVITQHG